MPVFVFSVYDTVWNAAVSLFLSPESRREGDLGLRELPGPTRVREQSSACPAQELPGAAVGLRAGRARGSEIPLPLRDRLQETRWLGLFTRSSRSPRGAGDAGPLRRGSAWLWCQVIGRPRTPVPLSSRCLFQTKLPKCLPSAELLALHHPALQQVPRASQSPFSRC